jgi:hypothetical protein
VQQTGCTVINVDDDKSIADDDTCTLCLQAILQIEDMVIQMDNADACVTIIMFVCGQYAIPKKGTE